MQRGRGKIPRTEKIAPINCDSPYQFTLSFRSVSKMSLNRHIMMNTHVIVSSALFFLIVAASHVLIQFATIAPIRPFARGVFSTVDDKSSCSNVSSSAVQPDCVSAEVNIVEEEQNMWRRIKKGTKFSARCRTQECFCYCRRSE